MRCAERTGKSVEPEPLHLMTGAMTDFGADTPALAIHAGAGPMEREQRDFGDDSLAREALSGSLDAGRAILDAGGSALDAVEAAVRKLEDFTGFNAGRGSVLTADGVPEMDAAIADGARRTAGAVATVSRAQNPISLARAVLEDGRFVLLVGPGAERFARDHDVALVDPAALITERRRRQLARALAAGEVRLDHASSAPDDADSDSSSEDGVGTVGAVARDAVGGLASATSTGGMTAKHPGRVGDSPLLGSGTWADTHCAVSGTGTGEVYIRLAFAHELSARVRWAGEPLDAAAAALLAEVEEHGGQGGVIAIGALGAPVLAMTTTGMPRGVWTSGGAARIAIYRDESL